MKRKTSLNLIALFIIWALGIMACNKNDFENKRTLKRLYKRYKGGSISECKYKGQTVYSASIGAIDAGYEIYDKDGNKIGECSFAWGLMDSICKQLTDCETIYRSEDYISSLAPIDKYNLGK